MVLNVGAGTSPVLYVSASIDITQEIVEQYDRSAAPETPALTNKPTVNQPSAK